MSIDTQELTKDQIRDEVVAWLRDNLPAEWVQAVESGDNEKLNAARGKLDTQDFLDRLAESGYAAPTWPADACGKGYNAEQAAIVQEELGRYRVPRSFNIIGIGMGGPTVISWGTQGHRERFLKPMLSGREIWCQLFSEPGHGSDVAGLSTRAVRSGDEWIVNGQKVWTTFAHMSKWGMLVARSDPDAQKHQGLTYFIVDMKAPGVTVRPLKQITGDAEFNEVFFEDVRIPDENRVGEIGNGWQVATTTLMNERVALGSGTAGKMPESLGTGPVDDLISHVKPRLADKAVLDGVMKLWVESAVLRLNGVRANMRRKSGTPGPEGSVGKLAQAEFNQRLQKATVDLNFPGGVAWDKSDAIRNGVVRTMLRSRANTIEGGTSEIMRNILGERVLGLPKDIDVSRELPWKDIPRSAGK